jgi:cytochrome P450/NADPH-cytochrome P450 reductase
MLPSMMDIASQMLLKWDRLGPDNEIICADDFTRYVCVPARRLAAHPIARLAFDVIGLCAFGYRFNNFYSEHAHPFVDQMGNVLLEAGRRATRLGIETRLRIFAAAKLEDNIKQMHDLCDKIIEDRIAHPQPDAKDLLNHMLKGVDKETGEKMTTESVRFNMVTFLVAGHETTSGTLGFLFYHLLKNPEKYHKAQQEVDNVLGDRPFEAKDLPHLVYIKFAIYEALRFLGPIGLTAKHAINPTKIAVSQL